MRYQYKTTGTCSSLIEFEVDENDILKEVRFMGGCSGNLQGISRLTKGMPIQDIIDKLEGTSCNGGPTSCPDQLATALKAYLQQKQ